MNRLPITFFVIIGAALAACTPQITPSLDDRVQPISDILASGPEFTNISSETALVLAETKISVVCAIVYGTTPDFGLIATDTDMAGGGHTEHHPLLTGLKSDTQYFARIQV